MEIKGKQNGEKKADGLFFSAALLPFRFVLVQFKIEEEEEEEEDQSNRR